MRPVIIAGIPCPPADHPKWESHSYDDSNATLGKWRVTSSNGLRERSTFHVTYDGLALGVDNDYGRSVLSRARERLIQNKRAAAERDFTNLVLLEADRIGP